MASSPYHQIWQDKLRDALIPHILDRYRARFGKLAVLYGAVNPDVNCVDVVLDNWMTCTDIKKWKDTFGCRRTGHRSGIMTNDVYTSFCASILHHLGLLRLGLDRRVDSPMDLAYNKIIWVTMSCHDTIVHANIHFRYSTPLRIIELQPKLMILLSTAGYVYMIRPPLDTGETAEIDLRDLMVYVPPIGEKANDSIHKVQISMLKSVMEDRQVPVPPVV
jgi:hypothetical protein